jgi:alkyl sulfatase BDS1-like metallo-beta-lactamase superfamily hydrolase
MATRRSAFICTSLSVFAVFFLISILSVSNGWAETKKEGALKINDVIYQATGFGNTFMVTTSDGNVIIDTSNSRGATKHKAMLQAINSGPVKFIILTHAHGDHTGGLGLWKSEETKVIAQQDCVEFLHYTNRLAGFYARRAAAQFPQFAKILQQRLARYEQVGWPGNYDAKIPAAILFDDKYEFEYGGIKFELFHTPGETYDQLSVWLPQYKVVHVADNFYDSFPNLYTLRGTKPRWALDFAESLNKVMSWEPEILIRGHGKPIYGREEIKKRLTQYRNAVLYVHDATVKGMNEGKDVFTLMQEIKLPPELDVGERYGKVIWSVRGIYEGYAGWFNGNPSTMYELPIASIYPEIVALAGGANTVAKTATDLIGKGDYIRGLLLTDIALVADPDNQSALDARLKALKMLKQNSKNRIESAWLGHGIRLIEVRSK